MAVVLMAAAQSRVPAFCDKFIKASGMCDGSSTNLGRVRAVQADSYVFVCESPVAPMNFFSSSNFHYFPTTNRFFPNPNHIFPIFYV